MSNYLIELTVIHMVLIFGYWLFLRNEKQYAKMRFYLIGATLLALTIPLLKLPKLFFAEPAAAMNAIQLNAISTNATGFAPAADMSIWNYELFIGTYVAISTIFLLKFISNVLYLIYLNHKSSIVKVDDAVIRRVRNVKGSFTFFNWIFVSDEITKNQQDHDAILNHEKGHVSLGHTYDLVFFEVFKVCFWWLPTAWFINKEIKKIHEYQADAYALRSYHVDQYSEILIRSALKSNGLTLTSSFYDGLILKRLLAMKQRAKNVSPWKVGVLASLCVTLFVVFACSEDREQKTEEVDTQSATASKMEGEVFTVVEELPQYPGGMDAFYKYVINEIKYPKEARLGGIEGRVDVQFVVEKDGSLSNVNVTKGIDTGCDNEAVRVVKNATAFKPGTQRGMPVRVRMVLPIIFKLNEGETNEDNSTKGIIFLEEVEQEKAKLTVDANYANGEWSGTVYDEEGEGLPGANIVVAGTTTGTVSDLDGTFKVKASESKDLHVSFVGYENVRLGGK
jgi:TonB family protein